ncbi:MAG: hypothetical protein ACFFEY_03445 [Candidatus Thorarchaeota archaeon]
MKKDESTGTNIFDDNELRSLNLFFGMIIVVLSIFVIFLITVDANLIMISVSLLIVGAAFTCIGIADKDQKKEAQKIAILFGFIVTIVGLIVLFNISFIMEPLIIQIMLLIGNITFGVVGLVAISAVSSEKWSVPMSRRIMILMGGAPMFGAALINIVILIFGLVLSTDFNFIVSILLFVTLLLHGLARIIIFYTKIYD